MKIFTKPTRFLAIIFSFVLSSAAFAQNEDTDHSLYKGSRALQFQITNNFNLSSFNGSFISYKRQISETKAQRIGVSLSSRFERNELEDDPNEREAFEMVNSITGSFTWQTYLNPDALVKMYYGFGPGAGIGYGKNENDELNLNRVNKSFSGSLSGLGYTGVEWFPHPAISFHAEYRASASIQYGRVESIDKNKITNQSQTNAQNFREFRLGGNGVRFGLSVYF